MRFVRARHGAVERLLWSRDRRVHRPDRAAPARSSNHRVADSGWCVLACAEDLSRRRSSPGCRRRPATVWPTSIPPSPRPSATSWPSARRSRSPNSAIASVMDETPEMAKRKVLDYFFALRGGPPRRVPADRGPADDAGARVGVPVPAPDADAAADDQLDRRRGPGGQAPGRLRHLRSRGDARPDRRGRQRSRSVEPACASASTCCRPACCRRTSRRARLPTESGRPASRRARSSSSAPSSRPSATCRASRSRSGRSAGWASASPSTTPARATRAST